MIYGDKRNQYMLGYKLCKLPQRDVRRQAVLLEVALECW